MTFSEAKRYNQSMQNMESGKHNPPGLSDADMDAWDFANQKVSEHIAVKKVDHNEVIKIPFRVCEKIRKAFCIQRQMQTAQRLRHLQIRKQKISHLGAIKGKGKSDAVVLGKFEDGKLDFI